MLTTCIGVGLYAPVHAQPLESASDENGQRAVITDLCRMIEALPGTKDPVRKSSAFRSVIRGLSGDLQATAEGKTLNVKRARRHVAGLEKALSKTLRSAQKAFRLEAEERWTRSNQGRAKTFLKKHVFTRAAPLRVGTHGFEPSPSLRAMLLWSACWAGDTGRMIAYGRGATHPDEGAARAVAALTLDRVERREEATELLDQLDGEGFLAALAQSHLADDKERRRKQRALAKRRATTRWQRAALGLEALPEDEAL
jgi:hypothetical protein